MCQLSQNDTFSYPPENKFMPKELKSLKINPSGQDRPIQILKQPEVYFKQDDQFD